MHEATYGDLKGGGGHTPSDLDNAERWLGKKKKPEK